MEEPGQPRSSRWLVLLYQLPARPSSARVRVWRRLQDVGAVQVRQSAYVLPNRDTAREDLEWVRSEIVALGGGATLFIAEAADAVADAELVDLFRNARSRDVARLKGRGSRWLARAGRLADRDRPLPRELTREAQALVRAWRDLAAITYFDVPGAADTEDLMQQIASRSGSRRASRPPEAAATDRRAYHGRTWVTRPRPGVDRMATAWLIRTHVDSRSTFTFAEEPLAEAVPFDMYGVEFGHQGDRCTFEVMAERFGIDDPKVAWIGRVVHDLDLREQRYAEPEAPGVALMVEGLRRSCADDGALLERGIGLFESLARARADLAPVPPAGTRRSRRTVSPARAAHRRRKE